ncbi:response regulator transcription factor [Eilatimonas milleporae]|uniref:Two-component system response regulator FixJ n=1 Tax=Eilatimonas milleporae TaxID=911205 RepID=A0A3M0CXR9_9PROT|nr:LuxR C-terminal-related transcriptional regulator [Eilatimonas milleporae]RMB12386.1 two-component system response regulator FixJ [Eilatimonas milleporae]
MSGNISEDQVKSTVYIALSNPVANPVANPGSNPGMIPPQVRADLEAAGLTLVTVASGTELLERFDADGPSCTVLDILLPPSGGLDILAKLRARRAGAPVLMVGDTPGTRVAVEAMRMGARDVLETPLDPHLLQTRVLELVQEDRGTVIAEKACADRRHRIDTLSRRESQVLDHVLRGLSNKEIARVLEVSPKAIECYRAGMMRKLGQRSSIVMAGWVSRCPSCMAVPLSFENNLQKKIMTKSNQI